MKWLLTISRGEDLNHLTEVLREKGCNLNTIGPPIPIDDREQVLPIEGPKDLSARLRDISGILEIHPDSELILY